MIKVILEGKHTNTYFDEYYRIEDLTSSVTLIKLKQANILVDTGSLAYREQILKTLQENNIYPKDINYIFNTHFHLDHVLNNSVFFNAKQVSAHAIFDLKTGKCDIYSNINLLNEHIPSEIKFFPTPGHFKDHKSVLYKYNNINYVIAGDIVREDIIRNKGFSANGVSQQFYDSMKLIFKKADVIIPGHGRIIKGKLFNELHSIVINDFPLIHGLKS